MNFQLKILFEYYTPDDPVIGWKWSSL